MITLDSLKSPERRPAIMTIVSDGGMGKTSLAAEFPRPVFIRTEDGTKSIEHRKDIALFPVAESSQDVFDAFGALLREDHTFGTVVLDTITQLNTMIEAEVVKADGKAKSINQAAGGYGAGYSQVAEVHRQIREVAGILSQRKNMHVLFLAHAETETVDPPDGDAYTRYSIRMHKKSVSHYSDNVDLVGFIKPQIYTVGSGEKKKATTDGTRIITCYPVPSHISKNRFGIESDLPYNLGSNPFADIIKEQ